MDWGNLFANGVDVPPAPEPFDVKQLPAHGGVWLLADEQGRPIQLGGCESLRRTISFRLSDPPEDEKRRARADVRAITRRIWWWPTYSQFETAYDYHRIARQLYPDDYADRLAFGSVWFVRVDPAARIPRLTPTQKVFASKATYIGPFTSRANCTRYIELLTELFGLCRSPDVLEQAPHGRRCAYYDMGKCPAPCDGSVPLERYRDLISDAVDFVRTGPEEVIVQAEREMKRAARAQEIELAAAAKRRIEEARDARAGSRRFVTVADQFDWLIVQRGPGRIRVKPFFVRGGWIDRGETVELKKLNDHVEGWLEALGQPSPSALGDDGQQRAEHVWLVSHFLFRSEKLPGLFLWVSALPDPEALCEQVRDAFAPRSPKRDAPPQVEPSQIEADGASR